MPAPQTTRSRGGRVRRKAAVLVAVVLSAAGGVAGVAAPAHAAGSLLYVTNGNSGTISAIDPASDTVVATIPVTNPGGIAEDPSGSTLYVTDDIDSSVSVINAATGTVTATVTGVSSEPAGIAIDPAVGRGYVACPGSSTVVVFSTATDTVVGSPIAVGRQPERVAVSPDGSRVYVSDWGDDEMVSVINTSTDTVVASIPAGHRPYALKTSPDGTRLYVTSEDTNSVLVIDTATNTVISTIPVGEVPDGIAVNPAGTQVYVSDMQPNFSGMVQVIDTATDTVTGSINVLSYPGAVTFNASGTTAYVVNGNAGVVQTIDTATQTVTGSITVGSAPFDITPDGVGQPSPAVTGVSPNSGPLAGGNTVTISGTDLLGTTAITFGGNVANALSCTATACTATAPAGVAGTVDVHVTSYGGTSTTSNADHYAYVAAPTVTAVAPNHGPEAGGTTVTITGTGLTGATSVSFGGSAANSFSIDSATQITATAPAGSDGTVDVTVTTPYGTSPLGASDLYTYDEPAPSVTSISPNTGPAAGATVVTITGTDLLGTTAVTFGTVPATGVTVVSDTQVQATAPAGTGTVDVTVTTAVGTSATTANDKYTYIPAGIAIDQTITKTGVGTVTTAPFSTTGPRLLVAFTSSDGPATKQTTTISGAGLTWTLARRANAKGGTAEIWTAYAAAPLSNVTVTSTPKTTGYSQLLTVEVFSGSSGVGAGAVASKSGGTPTVTLTTTKANSWVFGVGEDYSRAAAVNAGTNQSILQQYQDTANGNSYWVQDQNQITPAAGTAVTINDAAPTGDTWNLAAIEVLHS